MTRFANDDMSHVMGKTCFMPYANNDVDQPAQPRSPISIFVVRYLDTCCIKNFNFLASFSSRAGWFESNLVATPKRQVFSWHDSYGCFMFFSTECQSSQKDDYERLCAIAVNPQKESGLKQDVPITHQSQLTEVRSAHHSGRHILH